jgi:hypothetical protein
LNSDLDKSGVANNTFLEAYNLQLVGDGKFLALENIAGTTQVASLDSNYLGTTPYVYAVKARINSVIEDCLLIFTQVGSVFRASLFRFSNNSYTTIYEKLLSGLTSVIDAVNYPEGGIDIVYFTDGVSEIRKFRLEFTTPIPQFSDQQVSLQRRAPLGEMSFSHSTGGSLLTGSYQFSFRCYNDKARVYSKWSLLSTPRIVSSSSNRGGYGQRSDKKITVSITLPVSEQTKWTHTQIAVLENTTETNPITAVLQPLKVYSGGATSHTYSTNDGISIISLTDIVVDLAAIKFCKTLAIKNNRIFAGNVEYESLAYDLNPTVTSGSVITEAISGVYTDTNASNFKGYMRDETYRFYVAYFDDKYNFYRPFRLNMSGVSGNQIGNGDIRFPQRTGSFTVMNNANSLLQIGLNLTINSHPTRARGFAIFRAKRKKKKLFQTPLIPAVEIQGVSAVGSYPNIAYEPPTSGDDGTSKTYEAAAPMNPSGAIVPKNMFYTVAQHHLRRITDSSLGSPSIYAGEIQIVTSEWYNGPAKSMFFTADPAYLGGLDNYTPKVGDTLKIIDFAFTRLDRHVLSTSTIPAVTFDYADTSVHGTFYANRSQDYYHSFGSSLGYPLGTQFSTITAATSLLNYGEGTTLSSSFVGKFQNLETPGISFLPPPNNQRLGVIQTDFNFGDFSLEGNTIKPGSIPVSFFETGRGPNSVTIFNTATNFSVLEKVSFVNNASYVGAIAIADVENNLGDDRYGEVGSIHELEFTGAYKVFSDSEVLSVEVGASTPVTLNVFGGDVWVSKHNIKVTDGHYSVVNSRKPIALALSQTEREVIQRWGKAFDINSRPLCLPLPLKNVSQVLSVVLESEVHGQLTPSPPYTYEPELEVISTDKESGLRISFNDRYNAGFFRPPDQKVLIPFNPIEPVVTSFKARAVFSDQKVYNTDIQGFDSFPVGNFVDLDESFRGITKLALVGDSLFALQERGIALIPVDARTLSTTDGGTISVRSGTTDIPIYVSRVNGTQQIKSVQVLSDKVIFPDSLTGQVFTLGQDGLQPISEKGAISRIKGLMPSTQAEGQLFSMYDETKRQYFLFNPAGFCLVWDDRLGIWQDRLELTTVTNRFYGGMRINGILHVLGRTGTALTVNTLYTGAPNTFLGNVVTPRVKFVVNPDYPLNKTFDQIIAYATDPLLTVDIEGEKASAATGNSVFGMNFAVNRREGYYVIPVLRDTNGARIRSTRADITVKWPTTGIISLSQIVTNYRLSHRLPQ